MGLHMIELVYINRLDWLARHRLREENDHAAGPGAKYQEYKAPKAGLPEKPRFPKKTANLVQDASAEQKLLKDRTDVSRFVRRE